MKVSILQESLAKGLGVVGRAVSPRSTLPVLSNVLLATESGRLRISATNLQLGITTWLGANVEEEGATTVPARTFGDLVGQLSPERVDIDLKPGSGKMHLACGSHAANINVITADEFPVMPEPGEQDDTLTLPAEEMRQMIRQVAFAAANDDTRPILTGVLMEYGDGVLTMAAADGFRMAMRELPLDVDFPAFSLVVPAYSLKELERIAADEDGDVHLVLPPDRGQVLFYMSNAALVTQILEGQFPDYRQIIPRPDMISATTELDTQEFLRACKRADIFAREAANTVRLQIQPHDSSAGTVTLSAAAADRGDNEGVLAAHVEGEEMEVAFNVRYLMDVLTVLDDERVMLDTINSRSPGVIHPVEGNGLVCVVMPMHMG